MRDLFRLILVAVMSFAVIGTAMVYSRGTDLNSAVQYVTGGLSGAVADLGKSNDPARVARDADDPSYSYAVPRPHAAQWVGLAGFPDQTEVSFPLPLSGHYLSGSLHLDFETQLTTQGEGLMTLSVNGTPREQVVLEDGQDRHSVQIDLAPSDLSGGRAVLLQLAGRGTTSAGQVCPTDATNSGSAVTLLASSRLELNSDRPLENAVGALLMSPQPFVLAPDEAPGGAAFAVWANQQFNRSGIVSRLGDAGPGETVIRVSDFAVASAAVAPSNVLAGQTAVDQVIAATGAGTTIPKAWPVHVADLGAETTVKTFRGSRRWNIPFDAADMPGGALPEQLNLHLRTTPLKQGNDWLVRVSLNGNLVEAQRYEGNAATIDLDVALPAQRLLPRNALLVELVDTTPTNVNCGRAPEAQAQLLPESMFVDKVPAEMAWGALIEALAMRTEIAIHADAELSSAATTRASDVLAMLLPRTARYSFQADAAANVFVTDRTKLGSLLQTIPVDAGIKAVIPSRQDLQVLPVPSAGFGIALDLLGPDDVIVIATGV